jgi:hypothetical protein
VQGFFFYSLRAQRSNVSKQRTNNLTGGNAMKWLSKLLLVMVALIGMNSFVDASNGQIQESCGQYKAVVCCQLFICTPSGWVPFSEPIWVLP